MKQNPYVYMQGPRQEDVARIEKWLGVKVEKKADTKGAKPKVKGKK